MLSNNQIKKYTSLKNKKYREKYGLFIIERYKMVEEALKSDYEIEVIIISEDFLQKHKDLPSDLLFETSQSNLAKISSMKTAPDILAVLKKKNKTTAALPKGATILIDNIQNPGNLGTIIRTAHWFGIQNIVCSKDSVDMYNEKVLQASMGAFFKMNVSYQDLNRLIPELQKQNRKILGTFLEGESIYDYKFNEDDIFVLGNEGKGISSEIEKLIDKKITIPTPLKDNKTESLNIAIAGAVVCAERARQLI